MTSQNPPGPPAGHPLGEARFRPLVLGDEDALIAFHDSCSERTRYLRFFSLKPVLSRDEARRFCANTGPGRYAVAAVDPAGAIVGVGRFYARDDHDSVEVAFVVTDAWQGRGVGSALVADVLATAAGRGYGQAVAVTLWENLKMRRLISAAGRDARTAADGDTVEITVALDGQAA